ncbi:MAG: NAD(P)-binding domain-containing protein [Porticoccaceae bacterium]|nr:NAD(P)-binding domain-containing protein [Porticoccaceae bacterium]HLS97553.1 NAD(P)-binding domain-containing protein [Porticoccaceae bacterium]
MKVGFIGLGSMGYGQAMLLAKSEHELAVFDAFPAAMARFEGVARLATSLADVAADADVVGVCVRDDAQVNECADGLIPAMKADSVLLIHSTVNPKTMLALAERCAARGVHVLDAAVTRTVIAQDAPFVFTMLGGDEAIAARVQPVLDAYSTDTVVAGAVGAGMAMKIANNLVSWSQIMLGLEAFEMAEAAGVDTDKLLTVMTKNGVLTPPMRGFVNAWQNRDKQEVIDMIASQSGVGEKDLSLAEYVAKDAGAATPIGSFIRGFIKDKLNAMVGR